MNADTIALLENIAKVTATLLEGYVPEASIAISIIEIEQKARAAYESHTGEALDPANIKPIEELPEPPNTV